MGQQAEVVIAGGGIGGLATANAFRARGITVTVLERADEFNEIGAAIGVQTNAVRALREMGLADDLIGVGVPIENYEYVTWGGRRLAGWAQGEIARSIGEPTVVVHRADLQRVLLSGLDQQRTVRLDTQCVGYEQGDDTVTVHLGDGGRITTPLLIGADGLGSVVRKRLIGDQPARYSGWVAYRGVVEFADAGFPIGLARQTLGREKTFGMWHLPGGRVYWVATIREPDGANMAAAERKRHVSDAFAGSHSPINDIVQLTDENSILRNEVFDRVPVVGWSCKRVALLGDAAHPTTPVTGQGGGQAIIDAAVLAAEIGSAETLADDQALAAALDRYEARRRPVTTSITEEAWRIAKMHHFRGAVGAFGRDASLRLTPARVWNRRMYQRLAF